MHRRPRFARDASKCYAQSMSAERTERLLNLLTFLLNQRRPVSLYEIRQLEEFSAYQTADAKTGARAFERDKAALLELGVPLRFVQSDTGESDDDDSSGGYVIDRERYYLPDLHLSPSELALLSIAGAAAAAIEGFPGRAAVVRALAKLGFDAAEIGQAPSLAHAPILEKIGSTDSSRIALDLDIFHEAVERRRSVHILYLALSDRTPSERTIDPYGLYYRQGIWYVVAFCHLRRAERTFHLGRMQSVQFATNGRGPDYEVPGTFDLRTYVERRPWEFPIESPLTVRILLADPLLPALREIFGAQAPLEQSSLGAVVTLQVTHRRALIEAVLPYGAAAQVIEPADLRQEIAQLFVQLHERYCDSESGGQT